CNRGWGFGLKWSARTINNVPSFLFDKELEQVERLRAILSSSLAIRDMIEIWLVEASISTTPWGMDCFQMVNLKALRGTSHVPTATHAAPSSAWKAMVEVLEVHAPESRETRPKKTPKLGAQKVSRSTVAQEAARPGPTAIAVAKQRAVDLHIKVDRLKFILGKAQQEVNGLHWHLGDS
ncbi:hypothetical protein B296_00003700, partial [Ensete ventricosum]